MPALLRSDYVERCLWQTQVSPPPTTAGPLPSSVDVVVVGAGLCGLAAADTLARAGRSVVVLDREPLGWGSSSRNAGMVIPEVKIGPVELARRFGARGRRIYAEVQQAFDFVEGLIAGRDGRGGIDCDYERTGQLYLAHSQRHVGELEALAAQHEALGEGVRFVRGESLAAEIGSEAYPAGVVFPRTGGLHPARFHAGMAARALASGALLFDRTSAATVTRAGAGHRVVTTRGEISAEHVIVATNAAVDESVPWLARRVLPVGSYIVATEVLAPEVAQSVSPRGRMMVDTKNFLFYWRLTPDRRMLFGGRRSLDPVDVPAARDFLARAMVGVHPQLAGIPIAYAWGGYVAITLDRLPHVGQVDGAWYAAGCNGSGVALNTYLGHRLAQTVIGEQPPPALSGLRHRPIPLKSWSNAYLPVVSRWFSWQDRR